MRHGDHCMCSATPSPPQTGSAASKLGRAGENTAALRTTVAATGASGAKMSGLGSESCSADSSSSTSHAPVPT